MLGTNTEQSKECIPMVRRKLFHKWSLQLLDWYAKRLQVRSGWQVLRLASRYALKVYDHHLIKHYRLNIHMPSAIRNARALERNVLSCKRKK